MLPIRLYIEDFMCHSNSYIDFSQFNSALIVGKINNNDLYSNGVGKTVIFKAIEYVLFNQSGVNLEKIIRDDMDFCKVVFDFKIEDNEYRVSRVRTKKGSTDFSLLCRNDVPGTEEAYHIIDDKIYKPITNDILISKYWKDIGGRRTADTEKELNKLIKSNFTSFRSTQHFMQNDFNGLATATPSKRKGILREALDLNIYSKLEKLAKEKSAIISKDIDKHKMLIDGIGNLDEDINLLRINLIIVEENIKIYVKELGVKNSELVKYNTECNNLINTHSILENNFSSLLINKKNILNEISKIESSLKEYKDKKSSIIKSAKELISESKTLENNKVLLLENDYSQIDILEKLIDSEKEKVSTNNVYIQNNTLRCNELKVPVPDDNVCKHCRQPLTVEHKKICKNEIVQELLVCQGNILNSKKAVEECNLKISKYQKNANDLKVAKRNLENIESKFIFIKKEIEDKKSLNDEYNSLIKNFTEELSVKKDKILEIEADLEKSSIDEANLVKEKIKSIKNNISKINIDINNINININKLNNDSAVLIYSIKEKKENLNKKKELISNLSKLEKKYKMYPFVIQSFSSTGIPNLIIQNVLNDLQVEANSLLDQLKPGLQLSFSIEKTRADGAQDETLDINYIINGKERDYDQLSGAMKLAVLFSLKLGLSFLLQKMIGTDIKFLLLDEIDQSLDKASVDAFADIIKYFQKDFTILIITHNDRLKDKFSHGILVEQDINMVSKAEVVSSW